MRKETMRNCVVFFCGSSRCGFFSSSLFFCHWASIEFVELTQSQQRRLLFPLLGRSACENAPAYHSHCQYSLPTTIFVLLYICVYMYFSFSLSLRASILRLLFQVCRCLSSFSLLMFLLPLFVFSFPGSFFVFFFLANW